MVGPDSVVPSSSAGVQRRRDDDDDVEYEDSRTVIDAADVDVDIVQLLTRRLSVSPPSDVPFCPRALERRRMTASTSTECESVDSGTASDDDATAGVVSAVVCQRPPAPPGDRHLQPSTTTVEWILPQCDGLCLSTVSRRCPLYSLLSQSSVAAVVHLSADECEDVSSRPARAVCRCLRPAHTRRRVPTVLTGARLYEAVDSRGASEARKSLCQQDSDLMCSDDDDDDDELLDSEVSELLRSRSPRTLVSPDHSPYKRLRQPDCVRPAPATSSPGRSLHAGAITPLPRPSLDLYKMQRTSLKRRHVTSVRGNLNRHRPLLNVQAMSRRDRTHQRLPVTCCDPSNFRFRSLSWTVPCGE